MKSKTWMWNSHRIINNIVQLHWAGWDTDTLKLQSAGWQISVEQETYRHTIRFALKHPELELFGLSNQITFNYIEHFERQEFNAVIRDLIIPIERLSSRIQVHTIGGKADFSNFISIDAEPRYIENEIKDFDDFKIFQPLAETKEILVEPATVDDMLQEILKMQSPKQKEIRKRMLQDRTEITKTIHAQILSIAA